LLDPVMEYSVPAVPNFFLALARWCAALGGQHRIGNPGLRAFRPRMRDFVSPISEKRTMNPIVSVWRFTVRQSDGLKTTLNLGTVNRQGPDLAVELGLSITLPLPEQNPELPNQIEAAVHHVGLEVQRRLFRALIEKADHELVLSRRHGKAGAGIQRRGTRPFTFKTLFGEVAVERSRISHKHDGTMEIPSAGAWRTPHQLAITENLRDAVCDQMRDQSAGKSRQAIGQAAGQEDLLGRSTIIEILHREGDQLVAAQRQRAEAILADAPEADHTRLGSPAAEPGVEELSDAPPCEHAEETGAEAEWDRAQAEWAPTGLPGGEPAGPVAFEEPRQVDEGLVIVEPDEVVTKAQATTGRKTVWTYTAVVMVAGLRYALAEATAEGLWSQLGALLIELGVLRGERRLLVLGDGAGWIRAWFEGLGISPRSMIVCWWHLRKRCYEQMSLAGGPKDRRRALEKELLGRLWAGDVVAAVTLLRGALSWVRTPKAVEDLIGYLEKRREFIPDYQERRRAGLWIASTRVEKLNDWAVSGRCKGRGMSWSSPGVLALAAIEVARRNGELDHWREEHELPERTLPGPARKAA
jgi:hypothetical protein